MFKCTCYSIKLTMVTKMLLSTSRRYVVIFFSHNIFFETKSQTYESYKLILNSILYIWVQKSSPIAKTVFHLFVDHKIEWFLPWLCELVRPHIKLQKIMLFVSKISSILIIYTYKKKGHDHDHIWFLEHTILSPQMFNTCYFIQ